MLRTVAFSVCLFLYSYAAAAAAAVTLWRVLGGSKISPLYGHDQKGARFLLLPRILVLLLLRDAKKGEYAVAPLEFGQPEEDEENNRAR